MSKPSYDLVPADRLALGAFGPPGRRVFLLQGRRGALVLTVKVEKFQVAALAAGLERLLGALGVLSPEPAPRPSDPDVELEQPAEPAFVAGTIGLSYEKVLDQVLLSVAEAVPEDEDPRTARFGTTPRAAAALARHAARLVAAGRPPCPVCGHPLDPDGHACPRTNGHRPPAP